MSEAETTEVESPADEAGLEAHESVQRELALASVIGFLEVSKVACKDVMLGLADDAGSALGLAHSHLSLAMVQLGALVADALGADAMSEEAEDEGDGEGEQP